MALVAIPEETPSTRFNMPEINSYFELVYGATGALIYFTILYYEANYK